MILSRTFNTPCRYAGGFSKPRLFEWLGKTSFTAQGNPEPGTRAGETKTSKHRTALRSNINPCGPLFPHGSVARVYSETTVTSKPHALAIGSRYSKIGDHRLNADGSVSTLVDNGDGSIGTYTTGCPAAGPLYLHKRTGIISSVPETEASI